MLRFIRQFALFGPAKPFVPPLAVDQILNDRRAWFAQHGIHRRTEEGLEPALDMEHCNYGVVQFLPEHRIDAPPRLCASSLYISMLPECSKICCIMDKIYAVVTPWQRAPAAAALRDSADYLTSQTSNGELISPMNDRFGTMPESIVRQRGRGKTTEP